MPHLIVDAHEDLAYSALTFGRDYRRSALETRRQRRRLSCRASATARAMLGWPEYQRGQVALVFGTLFLAARGSAGRLGDPGVPQRR